METYSHEQIHYETETGMKFTVYDTEGFYNSKHWHNGLEIIYLISGKITITIDKKDSTLLSGGFAVVNSKTLHSVICREKSKHMLLQIPYEFLKKYIPDYDNVMFNCVCPSKEKCTGEFAVVRDDLEKLRQLYDSEKNNNYLLIFNSVIFDTLYRLVENFTISINPTVKMKSEKNTERLGLVIQFVRSHYAENISLNDAAEVISLNREYFSRFFKKYMGMTFLDYVYAVRLEYAYNDIVTTDYPIGTIAEKNGFNSGYTRFADKFKEQYGLTPKEARELSKKQ